MWQSPFTSSNLVDFLLLQVELPLGLSVLNLDALWIDGSQVSSTLLLHATHSSTTRVIFV